MKCLLVLACLCVVTGGCFGRSDGAIRFEKALHQPLPWLSDAVQTPHVTELLQVALRVAPRNTTLTVITMTRGIRRWIQNVVASLHIQQIYTVLVATFEERSLASCHRLKLNCVDARPYMTEGFSVKEDGAHSFGEDDALVLWWSKQRIAIALLKAGYTVHGMDADAVVFRNVYADYAHAVKRTGAAAIFAAEDNGELGHYINTINAGCYYATPAALPMFEAWVNGTDRYIDQNVLNNMAYKTFSFCNDHQTCDAVTRAGMVPVWRHPSFYGDGDSCVRKQWPLGGHCQDRLAYIHMLCVVGWENKREVWDGLGLWLVEDDGRWVQNSTLFEPCPRQSWVIDT